MRKTVENRQCKDTPIGSALASLPWPVVVTIQSTVSFVFLAAIFYIIIYFKLNFMFWL